MNKVKVKVKSSKNIEALPGSWTKDDYLALLEILDISIDESTAESEVKDFCYMGLADMEPDEAAQVVLNYIIGDALTEGQIGNLSHEMVEDKMWEEFADMSLHRAIYDANYLLFKAYNGKFPRPEAIEVAFTISGASDHIRQEIVSGNNNYLLQIISKGMDEHGLINRLFEDQLATGRVEEADFIIWMSEVKAEEGNISVTLISSTYWLEDYDPVEEYEVELKMPDEEED